MLKRLFILMLSLTAIFQNCSNRKSNLNKNTIAMKKSIHTFKVEGLNGGIIDFSTFKGKKILIVNTASECGFTPQYEGLEKLYETYKNQLVVVGFPANNFGGQEPGTNQEIASFCKKNYGVSFPMASKVSVKGDDIAPVFEFLTKKELNGVKNTSILWNFTKILLDKNGFVIDSYISSTLPTDESITQHLKQ